MIDNVTKVFITGDRSLSPAYLPLVSIEMLRAVASGVKVVTGDQPGVEALVRELARAAGIEVEVVTLAVVSDKPTADEWDARHTALVEAEIEVIAVHSDPHASSVVKSLFRTTSDDAVRVVTPADLLV